MSTETVVHTTNRRGWSARAVLGLPAGLVLFVLLNWNTSYYGRHAVDGRPVAVLLSVAAVFAVALWRRGNNPKSRLLAV